MALDTTTFAAALKKYYTPGRMQSMIYTKNPFFAMLPKSQKFPGSSVEVPLFIEDSQNRSADISVALAGTSNATVKCFSVTRVKDYSTASVSGEVIRASASDDGAFLRASKTAIDSAISSLQRSWANKVWRSGYGGMGTIVYTAGKTYFDCTNIADVAQFSINMRLVAAEFEGSGTLRNTTSATVTNVDRTTGRVTTDTNLSGTLSWATGDTVFCKGDRESAATPALLCVAGYKAWVPQSAPTSTAFFGVDRSIDTRAGGLRQDSRGQNIEEAIIDATELLGREGFGGSHLFCSFAEYANLLKVLSSKVEIEVKTDMPGVGFSGVRVYGARGPITVVPDHNIPADMMALVTMEHWLLRSMGDPIGFLDEDGLKFLRSATADSYDLRVGGYGNLICNAPGANVHIRRA